jgi:hypothetical protein
LNNSKIIPQGWKIKEKSSMTGPKNRVRKNTRRRFKDTTIIRIGSLGLAVVALLFSGVFIHFTHIQGNASSADTLPAASAVAPVQEEPRGTIPGGSAGNTPSNNPGVRGAVLSGNSLVYRVDKSTGREPIILTLFATDDDGDKLFYSVSNMPEGASFDPDTLTFSWTPRYNQAGTHTIRFEVSDGQASDYEDVTINVIQYGENWDVNVDGNANVLDIVLIGQHWNESGLAAWIKEDSNEDGEINVLDMIVIGQHWTG